MLILSLGLGLVLIGLLVSPLAFGNPPDKYTSIDDVHNVLAKLASPELVHLASVVIETMYLAEIREEYKKLKKEGHQNIYELLAEKNPVYLELKDLFSDKHSHDLFHTFNEHFKGEIVNTLTNNNMNAKNGFILLDLYSYAKHLTQALSIALSIIKRQLYPVGAEKAVNAMVEEHNKLFKIFDKRLKEISTSFKEIQFPPATARATESDERTAQESFDEIVGIVNRKWQEKVAAKDLIDETLLLAKIGELPEEIKNAIKDGKSHPHHPEAGVPNKQKTQ